MLAFCLLLLVKSVQTEDSFLHAKVVQPHGGSPLSNALVVPDMADLLGKEHPHDPIGEGAYQSHGSVMQRTTSENTKCEDGQWEDCYNKGGDYLDHNVASASKHGSGDGAKRTNEAEAKSGAKSAAVGLGLAAAMALNF